MSEVTRILSAIEQGDPSAAEQLLPMVYDELRRLAAQKMAQEKAGQTLEATALVHEAYLRLVDDEQAQKWSGKGQFYAAAAEAMRRILVERARRKSRVKHGGELQRVRLSDADVAIPPPDGWVLAIDQALAALEVQDAKAAELVKLRYFAGCSLAEAAALQGVSTRTADRYWAYAKAWLHERLQDE